MAAVVGATSRQFFGARYTLGYTGSLRLPTEILGERC